MFCSISNTFDLGMESSTFYRPLKAKWVSFPLSVHYKTNNLRTQDFPRINFCFQLYIRVYRTSIYRRVYWSFPGGALFPFFMYDIFFQLGILYCIIYLPTRLAIFSNNCQHTLSSPAPLRLGRILYFFHLQNHLSPRWYYLYSHKAKFYLPPTGT